MARWEPAARERLQAAALELFASQGYDNTTAAQIADAVGLTERTFFRHFSDKREVLFAGQDELLQTVLDGVREAPQDAAAMDVVAAGLRRAAEWFPSERRRPALARQSVIEQHPALRERERHKLAGLATGIAEALRERGITEPAATLAAESGSTIFGIAFAQWLRDEEERTLAEVITAVLDTFAGLAR